MWRAGGNWQSTELALVDETRVGLVQWGRSSMKITPGIVFAALRVLGLHALLLPARLRIDSRVSPGKPPGAFIVSELHVVPEHRGQGVGEALLGWAEARARTLGCSQIALHTLTTNPAGALYERCGYQAVMEATDDHFERLTGARGNVLFVKDLAADG